jgi:hypothetical protein
MLVEGDVANANHVNSNASVHAETAGEDINLIPVNDNWFRVDQFI